MDILNRFISYTKITKGFSKDCKYHTVDESGDHYLVRIFPKARYQENLLRFKNMKKAWKHTKSICEPIETGCTGKDGYVILAWVMGEDAIKKVDNLSEAQAYATGFSAGKILAAIHQVKAPANLASWDDTYNTVLDKRIENYINCPLKYRDGDAFIQYCESHRHLLQNRPQTFRHGDYHIGNFILDSRNRVNVIDFGLSDYGDPWEEFNRITWTVQKSPLLAAGMINGYFDNNIPAEFWQLMALYLCSKALYALPWSLAYGEEETEIMVNQSLDIYDWYSGMTETVPSWYKYINIGLKTLHILMSNF